jgi:hypothetical protein
MQEEIQDKKYKNVEEESLMNTWQKWEDQWKCVCALCTSARVGTNRWSWGPWKISEVCAKVYVWVLISEAEVHENLVKGRYGEWIP